MKFTRLCFYSGFVFVAISNCFATDFQHKQDCSNSEYKEKHPYECASITAPLVSSATVLGGAIALISLSSNSSYAPQETSHYQPTLPTYNFVGGDIDSIHLANVAKSIEYTENLEQYNDIRLAYSIARGYTGRGTNIAILDAGLDSWHGQTVHDITSGPIAPDASIESYKIAYDMDFLPYEEIGKVIAQANDADIFNASWSVSMRATALKSRQQLERLTGETFVNELSNAAERDAIFVWAAGNDSSSQSSALSALPSVMPELQGHFVNVVAWDSEKKSLADYSNACGITKSWCITAPGTNISTGESIASGTSFATPIVSAAIAVIKEAFPYMKATEITNLLFETARDLGSPGIDEIYGHGMLDLEHATRPVGAPLIPLDNGIVQELQPARVSGTIAHNIKKVAPKFAYFDKYGRAFDSELSNVISVQNQGIGFQRLRQDKDIIVAKTNHLEFGLQNSDILFGDSFLQNTDNELFGFMGIQNDFDIAGIKFFQRARISIGMPRTTENSIINDFSNIYMASVDVGASMGDLSFGVSIPDTIISGTMDIRLPTGRTENGTILYNDYVINMLGTPAIEYTISYKSFTASFVDNPYGTDEFFIMSRAKISF